MFLEQPVEDYCNNILFLPDEEIDETGLRALNDTFLLPAGLSLEVVNLHNNSGSEADVINYPSPDNVAEGGIYNSGNQPTVRLLFTPGHYDIIYKIRDEPLTVARAMVSEHSVFGLMPHDELFRLIPQAFIDGLRLAPQEHAQRIRAPQQERTSNRIQLGPDIEPGPLGKLYQSHRCCDL